jgi:hypothetical protein
MWETTIWLSQAIGALILVFLVWLEVKTGLVLNLFALYDDYPHVFHAALLLIGLVVSLKLIGLTRRRRNIPQPVGPFSSSPYTHRRTRTPEFPPGMEFDRVLERWEKFGMEAPRMKQSELEAVRLAEVPPMRRSVFSVPILTSQLPQSDDRPNNAAFEKVDWS